MITAEEHNAQLGGPDTKLYQPLEHAAFHDREVMQPCEERWKFITSAGLPKQGSCIDIGCNTGWFCRKFSHLGWDVLGIDTKTDLIEIARNVMRPFDGKKHPSYLTGDIASIALPECTVALCLSVVMYWFNPEFGKTPEEGWRILDRVSKAAPKMFLDYGGQYNTLPKSFAVDVVNRTEYEQFQWLGDTDFESRPFYYFSKEG